MADVEVLPFREHAKRSARTILGLPGIGIRGKGLTLIPSSEKQGGTADDSSSASDSKTGNFSTADIGISPR